MAKRKKLSERALTLKFPTLTNQDVHVVLTSDVPSTWVTMFHEPCHPDTLAGHMDNGDGSSILILPTKASPVTVAHECIHAVFALFRYVGMELDDEAVAQHHTYLMDEILKFQKAK